jgi:LCP family protein required for cell wall assembly
MTDPAAPRRRRPRRSWAQRLTLLAVSLTAFACFAAAGALGAGQWVLSQRNLAPIATPAQSVAVGAAGAAGDTPIVVPVLENAAGPGFTPDEVAALAPTTTERPLTLAEPDAANFLVVGADNHDCAGDSITGDRTDVGERSDTIMVWRANPDTNQLAVLSFPRDLYVKFPNGGKNRINAAYERDDPNTLIKVLDLNFGVPIDHYIQIDFCAFRRLVDAVGGVAVPFAYPAKDQKGSDPPLFLVEQTGCVNLDGDTALAYVRSRHYKYEDPPGSGNWVSDPTSDFGRINRQQDFLRRVLSKVIGHGLYDPSVVSALVTTNRDYITTDPDLTLRKMLEFANALRNFDASSVGTYRIESSSQTTPDGDKVEEPRIKNDNMRAILAVFRGEAALASAPEQVFQTTTTVAQQGTGGVPTTPAPTTVARRPTTTSTTTSTNVAPATTLPVVEASENALGVAPDRSVRCD